MDTKESVKRALWHKATDPGSKETTKTYKNNKKDNSESCSFKESKKREPTEYTTDLGKEDAAEGTKAMYIQMGAKAFAQQSHRLYKASNKPATKKHKTNMADEKEHREVDPQGHAYKTRLL